jgi:hypothetical protein
MSDVLRVLTDTALSCVTIPSGILVEATMANRAQGGEAGLIPGVHIRQ